MKPTLLVLAAGMGSRYGGLKQIDKLGPSGETIIDYSVYDAKRCGFGKVVFIIREAIREEFEKQIVSKYDGFIECSCVMQEIDKLPEGFVVPEGRTKPWGTGHAMIMAAEEVTTPFAVINADDFYGYDAIKLMGDFLKKQEVDGNKFAMMGYRVDKTLSPFGTVSRGVCSADENGCLKDITEVTKIAQKEHTVYSYDEHDNPTPMGKETLVSMNLWGFTPLFFNALKSGFITFLENEMTKPKSEYYIPTEVNRMIEEEEASVAVIPTISDWFGVTYKEDKPIAVETLKKMVAKGVYPEKLF